MRSQRIYIDTSVIGGCFDTKFMEESRALVQMARDGGTIFVISNVVLDELDKAPREVQKVLANLPSPVYELVESSMVGSLARQLP